MEINDLRRLAGSRPTKACRMVSSHWPLTTNPYSRPYFKEQAPSAIHTLHYHTWMGMPMKKFDILLPASDGVGKMPASRS